MACLIVGCHVVVVEIPVELCFARLDESLAEAEFHFLHHVEAYEEVGVIIEGDVVFLCHFAVEHSFVSQLLGTELGTEGLIDFLKVAP